MSPSKNPPKEQKAWLFARITCIRNAGVTSLHNGPRVQGLRFINSSSLVAASLVFFFGIPLSVISGQFALLIIALPITILYCMVIVLHYMRNYKMAVWTWQATFCFSTFIFGVLEREVIDATHMIPFLIAAPAFVLWRTEYRAQLLPECILLAIYTFIGLEVSKELNVLPALPLKQYYWYFKPSTYVAIYFLNIMVFMKLLDEMDIIANLTKSLREERKAKAQVQKTAEQMQLYAAVMTHEIKSPLSILQLIGDAIKRGGIDAEQISNINQAEACVNHLQSIVDNAQILAKLNSGDPPAISEESFSIRELFKDLVSMYSYKASTRGVGLVYACSAAVPSYIKGSTLYIKLIVSNLLSNAIKFSKPGTLIRINITLDDGNYSISIQDQGVGIRPTAIEKVFNRFYSTNDGNAKGVGIGLFVSRQLALLMQGEMQGEIHVESKEQIGSVFTLALPLRIAAPPTTNHDYPLSYRIHIIEDYEILAGKMATGLEKHGFITTYTVTAEDAISDALIFKPHLILLDLGLPGEGGEDLLRRMREHPELAKTAVMILSGSLPGVSQVNQLYNDQGIIGYAHKPLGPDDLNKIFTYFQSLSDS